MLNFIDFLRIDPVIFSIGPLDIRWYSVSYILGLILGIQYMKYLNNKLELKLNNFLINDFFLWAALGIIIGGRLGYVILYNPSYYLNESIEILQVWKGGMSFHGGLIGVIFSLIIFASKNKINLFILSDLVACAAPIGIFFGRIANFINGELFGRITESNLGIIFSHIDKQLRHPSQIYEALFEGLLLFIILFFLTNIKKIRDKNGFLSAFFLILYSIFRFICEFFREPDSHIGLLFLNLSLGQIYCIPFLFIGFFIFLKRFKKL